MAGALQKREQMVIICIIFRLKECSVRHPFAGLSASLFDRLLLYYQERDEKKSKVNTDQRLCECKYCTCSIVYNNALT